AVMAAAAEATLWRAWGVTPDVATGTAAIAAAYAAGAIDAGEAIARAANGLEAEAEGAYDVAVTLCGRDGDLRRAMLAQLGELVVRGGGVDWSPVDGRAGKTPLDLPTYPWQRQRFWLDDAPRAARHPWVTGDGATARVRLALAEQPELADHVVHGRVVVPAA